MSKFLSVQCKCGNKLVVFGNATDKVACGKCNAVVSHPTGGRAHINGKIMEVLP
ncbi:30S ribosomal protein S27e [Candidatus Micrarchaeota archaeon]|nr:30S ribosomal protein S27e [Candidatus Micrarchaeota archaeon]MBI5177537.1 30S ribosomal protein S27e [Candidatus Micrarchaeota archaeon]